MRDGDGRREWRGDVYPDPEKSEGGAVADPEPDWIRIQSVKCIRTRKRVMEVTQGRYGGWGGGGGG